MVYAHLRGNICLKSQVRCNIPRQVAGTYKTIIELEKTGMSHAKITYFLTSMTLSYKRDYTITEDSVSIITFSHDRKTYKICNYPYAKQLFRSPRKFEASKVVKHKDGDYYFHLTYHKNFQTKKIEEAWTFMGIDLGINSLAVASTTDKKCKSFADGEIKTKETHIKIREPDYDLREFCQLRGR